MNIFYERYSPRSSNEETTAGLIRCYRSVFADSPWHEWKKCLVCGESWGLRDRPELKECKYVHCGEPVVDYWPEETVRKDLEEELTAAASCWIAKENDTVIGFCWGYPIGFDELQVKLGLELPRELSSAGSIAYQDDLGVLTCHRGRGIAHQLFLHRLGDFLSQGLVMGVVRTRRAPEPSVTYQWFTEKLGYRIMALYPGTDGRVVLANHLTDVSSRLLTGAPG